MTSSPEGARSPAQSPEAVQVLASVEAQVRRDVELVLTLAGFAVRAERRRRRSDRHGQFLREIVPPGPGN